MRSASGALAIVLGLLALASATAFAQAACEGTGAVFDSVEGLVEINRGGSGDWIPAVVGYELCSGDSFRVGPTARASVRLRDGSGIRLESNARARWSPTEDPERSLWEIIRGRIFIISRDPLKLDFTTPFSNAGLEGTEFIVDVTDGATEIVVIEGAVSMQNALGTVTVAAGERGVATAGAPVVVTGAADYLESLDWARDFSPLWRLPAIEPDQEPSADQANDAAFYANRAAQRLNRGQRSAAEADLARALDLDPSNPFALAFADLVSMEFPGSSIAALAAQFRAPNPDPTLALLTEAVERQNAQDWTGARESLEQAVESDSENVFAWAELAETCLALDDFPGAQSAARRAIELDPELALAHTVLGFVQLADFDYALAISSFERAIVLDQSAPLPHLGLGDVRHRLGEHDAGRREYELAVLLDPADPVLRSYGATVYHDERLELLAASQVGLAKTLDATEPTAYLFNTLIRQSTNMPVDALREFNQAAALNYDRPMFRSTLLLDADPAVSNAGLGRVFSTLGYDRLALAAGVEAIQGATRNHAGYRLLADTYAAFPRYQYARLNELWVSQLLQPLNTTSLPPQLAEPNLFILDSAGPAALSFNEFNPLQSSNHWTVQGAATYGGNDTRGENLTLSGIQDRISFSIGQYGFETDGFRENNDVESDVANVFMQIRPNAITSWIGELRSSEVEKGDLRQLFNEDLYNPLVRDILSVDSLRLGMHRRLGEVGDVLAAVHLREGRQDVSFGPSFGVSGSFEGEMLDVQHRYRRDRWQLTTGANVATDDMTDTIRTSVTLPFPPFLFESVNVTEVRSEFRSAYAYSDFRLSESVTLTFGGSFDELEGRDGLQEEFNPKLGLAFTPNSRTTLRAAAFSTLQGNNISKEIVQPRLEPTTVAGFNQFFFGATGDEVERYALALDRRLSPDLSYGVEISRRDIETGIVVVTPPADPLVMRIETAEDSGRAYVYWTIDSALAFSAELQADVFDNNGLVLGEAYSRLETLRLPVQLRYFHSNGFGAGIRATYADQSGVFTEEVLGPGGIETIVAPGEDRFWVFDANLTYRLRGRRGMLNLTMHNFLDEDFHFQDLDPENPRIMPDRLISFGFTLAL